MKQRIQQTTARQEDLDRLIAICREQLHLLLDNQENWWQYPPITPSHPPTSFITPLTLPLHPPITPSHSSHYTSPTPSITPITPSHPPLPLHQLHPPTHKSYPVPPHPAIPPSITPTSKCLFWEMLTNWCWCCSFLPFIAFCFIFVLITSSCPWGWVWFKGHFYCDVK